MEKLMQKSVKSFMTKKVIAVRETETIKHLFQLMNKHGILGVPVVDRAKKLIGLVTESDLIRHFTTLKGPQAIQLLGDLVYLESDQFNRKLKEHCAETVEGLMTRKVVTIGPDATLQQAIDCMASARVNRLPVVDKKSKLLGILTRTDIIRMLAKLKLV